MKKRFVGGADWPWQSQPTNSYAGYHQADQV